MKRKTASDYDPELMKLYDRYVHDQISRRDFLDQASKFAVGGLTAAALLESLVPNYALAQQVAKDDERLKVGYKEYESPKGYDAWLSGPAGKGRREGARYCCGS